MSMTKAELRKAIAEIIDCPPDTLDAESALNSVPCWDSIAQIDIMMLLSEKFGIEISDATILDFSRFENIMKLSK